MSALWSFLFGCIVMGASLSIAVLMRRHFK
jgi:hypothetical protein